MAIRSVRAKNFLLFEDTGWLHLNKINLIYGPNSSGKSLFNLIFEMFKSKIQNEQNDDYFSLDEIPLCNKLDPEVHFTFKFEAKSSLSGLLHPIGISDTNPDTDIYLDLNLSFVMGQQNAKLKILDIQVSEIAEEQVLNIKSVFKAEILNSHWKLSSDYLGISLGNQIWNEITLTSGFIPSIGGINKSISELIRKDEEDFVENNNDLLDSRDEINYLYKFLNRVRNEILRFLESTDHLSSKALIKEHDTLLSQDNANIIVDEISAFPFDQDVFCEIQSSIYRSSGVRSIANLIQNSLHLQRDDIALIEHPETFLDNKAQLTLMDYLLSKATEQDVKLIIETHSEMMILRLMKRIKQTTKRKLQPELSRLKIHQQDVSVWVVNKNASGRSVITKIDLNDYGELRTPWPGGFFEDGFTERFS